MSAVEDLAHALARDVIAAMEEMDDERFYDKVGKVVADGSPTLHEAFMTAIRVRLAEKRARAFLNKAIKDNKAARTADRTADKTADKAGASGL